VVYGRLALNLRVCVCRQLVTRFPVEFQALADHLWPLTNTVPVNRHFGSIEELEGTQAERCIALQGRRDLIRQGDAVLLVAAAHRSPAWPADSTGNVRRCWPLTSSRHLDTC
jgi:hypothetical protein